jgi:hypothetical protein
MKRLEKLENSILESVETCIEFKLKNYENYDVQNFEDTVEITHNKQVFGEAHVIAEIEILEPAFSGDRYYPPHGAEYKVTLKSINVLDIYSKNDRLLPNIVKKMNANLEKYENKHFN